MPRQTKRQPPVHFDICELVSQAIVSRIKAALEHRVDQHEVDLLDELSQACALLSCVTKVARLALAEDTTFRYFYAFLRYARSGSLVGQHVCRFNDHMLGVRLFEGEFGAGPRNPDRYKVASVQFILTDRRTSARLLCRADESDLAAWGERYGTELNVPPRVSMFVARARWLAQAAARNKPQHIHQCGICGCAFLKDKRSSRGPTRTAQPVVPNVFGLGSALAQHIAERAESSDEEEEAPPTPRSATDVYWRLASCSTLSELPPVELCSAQCARNYDAFLARAFPVDSAEAELYEFTHKVGLPRVAGALRAAFKRNINFDKKLRTAGRLFKGASGLPVDEATILRVHRDITDMLNVDTGLLMAAAAIAESPATAIGRRLAATGDCWRSEGRGFGPELERVKAIYRRHKRALEPLVTNQLRPPDWLRRVKEGATDVFAMRR